MTDEQIKQNAEIYARYNSRANNTAYYAYIEGAHSRDEEISRTQESLDECRRALFQLRNPWISVDDSLPEKEKDCENTSIMVAVICKSNPNRWYPAEYWFDVKRWFCCEQCVSTDYLDNVTHWMPTPKLKEE